MSSPNATDTEDAKQIYLGDLVYPLEGRLVELVRFVEKGRVPTMIPHVEFDVLEVAVHELVQLITKDVLVHSSLKNQELEFIFGGEQGALILPTRQSEQADLRVLSRDASDPGVLGELRHIIGICDARFDESLGGLAPRVEVVGEETRDELDDPGVGHFSVHAHPGKSSRDYGAGDGIRAVVTQNVSGDDS